MTDLVIHNVLIVTLDPDRRIVGNGTLVIDGGNIQEVRPTKQADRSPSANVVIDGSDKLAMPGLIDAHRHTGFSLVQGIVP